MPDARTVRRFGLDPDLPLDQECASFYLLERMTSDGVKAAEYELGRLEERLSREFARYLDLAVGGELRYAVTGGGEDEGDYVDHCPSSRDYCIPCVCGMDCSQSCYDCWACEVECSCEEPGRDQPEAWQQWQAVGGNPNFVECCGSLEQHSPTGGPNDALIRELPKVASFLDDTGGPQNGRTTAWSEWRRHRERMGTALLDDAVKLFDNGTWNSGFGGENWGLVARILRDFYSGKLKPRIFIDRCWTMEHNGGCVFDKAYSYNAIDRLRTVLAVQANNRYDDLADRWASPIVGHMWRRQRRLRFMQHDPIWLGREHDWFGPDEDWKEAR